MPYDPTERMNTNGRISEQKADYSIYEKGTTQRRIGPYHGVKYIAVPRSFVQHRWMFRDILGLLGCDIFEVFFLHLGDEGLFPSTYTISNMLGISQQSVEREIKKIAKKTLVCPICGYNQTPPLRIIKNKSNGRNLNNDYDIIPFLDFLQHIDESHWSKDDADKQKIYKKSLREHKETNKKSDF